MRNKNFIKLLLLPLAFFICSQSVKAECVTCPQFVPQCEANEELILQTCEACAHCVPKSNSDKECIACIQVVPNCSPNEELVLQTCEACAHCKPKSDCEVSCGKRCCKAGKKCVTIDKCKGKLNCKKPIKFKCKS